MTGFYGSNDPTNSVKALKEDVSKDEASILPGPPHRVTIIQHICSRIDQKTWSVLWRLLWCQWWLLLVVLLLHVLLLLCMMCVFVKIYLRAALISFVWTSSVLTKTWNVTALIIVLITQMNGCVVSNYRYSYIVIVFWIIRLVSLRNCSNYFKMFMLWIYNCRSFFFIRTCILCFHVVVGTLWEYDGAFGYFILIITYRSKTRL